MNILNIGPPYLSQEFRDLGHNTLDIQGWSKHKKPIFPYELQAILTSQHFQPDVVLWCDGSEVPNVFGWEMLPAVTLGFSIDLFCNPWHIPYSVAFDHLFVAQKDFIPLVTQDISPRRGEWLPLFCKSQDTIDLGFERNIPVSFVGTIDPQNIPARKHFFDALKKRLPILIKQGCYQEIFGRSHIVMNQSAVGEVNFRTFEAAACGAAVLTEDTQHGLYELFTPWEEILLYPRGNIDAAAAIATEWLHKPIELAGIANAGKQRAIRDHSAKTRARRVIELAQQLLRQGAQEWRLQNIKKIHYELEKSFTFICAELDSNRFPELQQLFLYLAQNYSKRWKELRKEIWPFMFLCGSPHRGKSD